MDNVLLVDTHISTHSPRAGRTYVISRHAGRAPNFNSLAPCGANPLPRLNSGGMSQFQLTRPVRGEPAFRDIFKRARHISTHSPRAGRTRLRAHAWAVCNAFQLTRPVRGEPNDLRFQFVYFFISTHSPRAGRTDLKAKYDGVVAISTHSPRAGRTLLRQRSLCLAGHFNSLAPCGANPPKW